MPRRARESSNSGCYHVMMRGVNGSTIFHDEEDCQKFWEVILECREPLPVVPIVAESSSSTGDGVSFCHQGQFLSPTSCDKETAPDDEETVPSTGEPAQVYLYCLMGNHIHLLVKEGSEGLATYIKRIGVRYAAYFNYKYQRRGHLFQDRFRSEPVHEEGYFLSVFRYICRNPVKAGYCASIGNYEWCNYRGPGVEGSYGIAPSSLPMELTEERIEAFLLESGKDIVPFRERLTDPEAEALAQALFRISWTELAQLKGHELTDKLSMLNAYGVTLRQLERLTGIPKSNLSRMLR